MGGGSVSKIVRGGFWLYASSITNNVSGFLYWMVISAVTGPSVVGIVSAIAGFSSMIAGLVTLGIGTGSQRFYGKAIGEGDEMELSRYFWSSFIYATIAFGGASLLVISSALMGYRISGLSPLMLLFSGVFIAFNASVVANSLLTSLLRTDISLLASIVGNALKFVVGVGLVLIGWGWIGAVIGYICPGIVRLAIYLEFSLRYVVRRIKFSLDALRDVLAAGLASWLPGIIDLLGRWLGVLAVFGFSGAVETGYYYVAYAIAGVVLMVASSMLGLLFPVLSGMSDGRKRAASRVLGVSSVLMFPLAIYLMVYPSLPLSLLGRRYIEASPILFVLLLSSIPMAISSCVYSLIYAYGLYGLVLALGLASNIPRMVLYYLLVPLTGGLGAAISFTSGSFTGFAATLLAARRVNFQMDSRRLLLTIGIPSLSAILCHILDLPWFAGGILILGSCLVGYPLLGIIGRDDLREVSLAFLSREKASYLYYRFKPLIDFLFRD